MNLRKGALLELDIEKPVFGGLGLARLDRFVVLVRGGLPGDRLRALVTRRKKDYAEARTVEVLEPSPDRVQPPCPYAGYCGGCQWQHARYERQLQYKSQVVRESVSHIGGVAAELVRETVPSPEIFGYRNKMEFSFSDRRWYLPEDMASKPDGQDFALGLHIPGTFDKVLDVAACLLQSEYGNRILREVKAYAGASGFPPYGLKSHEGFWRFLTLRHSRAFDRWLVNLVTTHEQPELLGPLAESLASDPRVATVVNNQSRRKAAVAVGERETVLLGEGSLEDRIGPHTFRISANSFFQSNPPVAERLYRQVLRYAELSGTERVLDLYSGTGTIPIYLAAYADSVTGIEINASAVADAERNCRFNGVDNCRFLCGDIRETLPGISPAPQVLVIDPPRVGLHPDVTAQVLALAPRRLIYVSCNPATLARDLKLLLPDYEPLEIQPFDMFPHTYHVEAVTLLVRRSTAV